MQGQCPRSMSLENIKIYGFLVFKWKGTLIYQLKVNKGKTRKKYIFELFVFLVALLLTLTLNVYWE